MVLLGAYKAAKEGKKPGKEGLVILKGKKNCLLRVKPVALVPLLYKPLFKDIRCGIG